MTTKQRWLAIAAFGLVVLILAIKAPAPDDTVAPALRASARPNVAASGRANQAVNVENIELDKLQTRHIAKLDKEDMFQSKTWYVPPPPPPKPKYVPPPPPPPPPPPSAPPLPFSYMGSYQEPGAKQVVYLSRGDKLYTVSAGDTVDGTYKIESIKAGQVVLMYLPLNITQYLRIGDR